jgi:hypothetical protein
MIILIRLGFNIYAVCLTVFLEATFWRTSGSSQYQISKAEKSIVPKAIAKYRLFALCSPPGPETVAWGKTIMSRLMILKPWEKARRYQGQAAVLRRRRSCTRAIIVSRERRTGSHHSWVLRVYEDTGKRRSGSICRQRRMGIMTRLVMYRLSIAKGYHL